MSMNYDITPQRQAYIDARGYTIVPFFQPYQTPILFW